MSGKLLSLSLGALAVVGTARASFAFDMDNFVIFDVESKSFAQDLPSLQFGDSEFGFTLSHPGATFDVVDISSGSGTVTFGTHTIAPNEGDTQAFTAVFAQPVGTFSLTVGDFGDDLDVVDLTAFDEFGTIIATDSVSLPPVGDTFSSQTLFVSAPGIASASITGGSVLLDNFDITVGAAPSIPLPPAAFAALAGMIPAGLFAYRMRRNRQA